MTAAQQPLFDDVGLVDERSEPRRVVREDQPIYRYHAVGPDALSTAELLALVLGCSSLDRAAGLLATFGSLHQLAHASHAQLMRIMGIGEAQAARLKAIVELSRRLQQPPAEERPRVTCPADAIHLLMPALRDLDQEELWVVILDTRNRVLKTERVYRGSVNTSVVRVAELFRTAIELQATAILIAHNGVLGAKGRFPTLRILTRGANC